MLPLGGSIATGKTCTRCLHLIVVFASNYDQVLPGDGHDEVSTELVLSKVKGTQAPQVLGLTALQMLGWTAAVLFG